VAKYLVPGTHGTTFGGNPLACTAGNVVMDVLQSPGFLEGVVRKGEALAKIGDALVRDFPTVFEHRRGRGLIQGLKSIPAAPEVQGAFTAEGLMVATGGENVVRLMPALVVTESDIAEAGTRMRRGCEKLAATAKVAAQ